MTITTKVIADTVWQTRRITTLHLHYPRFVHPQLLTHRIFARNARSSRATPVAKLIASVREEPVYPSYWGKNQRGMVAAKEIPEKDLAIGIWERARNSAIASAELLAALGTHKEVVNRLLEPFSHIDVLLTATHSFKDLKPWESFFELRCAPDAQHEIQEVANAAKQAIAESEPKHANKHLPFQGSLIADDPSTPAICAARCARISYAPYDTEGNEAPDRDLELFEKLVEQKHLSPLEHVAFAVGGRYGVFTGWRSLRHYQ